MSSGLIKFAIDFLSLLLLVSFPEIDGASRAEKVVGRNGVVVTDETGCSEIGRDILRKGGHAIDAAVAATLCLGVKSPIFSGLGGGGFMLVRLSNGSATVFDMREMAPAAANKNMYCGDQMQYKNSPRSIAVPGQLAGLYTSHKQYGKLPWAAVVKPAENLARNGFKMSHSLHQELVQMNASIMANMDLKRAFTENGEILPQGRLVKFEKLANTLALIAKHGMNIFYNGYIGDILANDIRIAGGLVTINDLKRYQVKTRKPLVAKTWGYDILTVPPPAAGGAMMILILNILSNYNKNGTHPPLLKHRAIEALKFALAMRMDLGDPAFVKNDNVLNSMISKIHAKKLWNRINDNQTFNSSYYMNKWMQKQDHGTTHIIVVDRQRNVVTMTNSINSYFGSKFMSPSTGIYLNNQMMDFSNPQSKPLPAAPANFIQPFKRPLSSMAPAILLKGKRVKAVIGAAGGAYIPGTIMQVLLNRFMLNKGTLESVMAPRFYHTLEPNVLYYENYRNRAYGDKYKYDDKTLGELKKKGHILQEEKGRWSACQFVVQHLQGKRSGRLVAVSDPRKGGFPASY